MAKGISNTEKGMKVEAGATTQKAQVQVKASTKKLVKVGGGVEGCSGPTWNYMINEYGLTSNELTQLRKAVIPANVQGKRGTLVRVFDPTSCQAKGIYVKDFNGLNDHPELILYEGYFHWIGATSEILMEKRSGTGPSLLERELRDGGITEVGMIEERSSAGKWTGRFLTFLIGGGFLIILFLIAGIIFAIAMLT